MSADGILNPNLHKALPVSSYFFDMHTVIGVGFSLPSKEDDYIRFDSKGSLSDADIAIIDPSFNNTTSYSLDYPNGTFQGKSCYSIDSSFRIKEHLAHWKKEIENFLKAGKTVFILLSEKQHFFVHTGQKQTSGTGRNQKVTNIVEEFDNYRFLPTSKYQIQNATGSKIYPTSPLIKNLYECCKEVLDFQSFIDTNEQTKGQLFATKTKDKTLGIALKVSNGHLIFIPALTLPDSFETANGDWSKEAILFGKKLKICVAEIAESLQNNIEKTPAPDWISDSHFQLEASESTKKLIDSGVEKIKAIEQEIVQLKEVLKEQESLKDLLYETGKPLELAVIKALKLLGYEAENYNDGVLELDQIIISPEKDRFIGECEGKENKDIDITKFRQLLDALNEDFAREEVEEKALGILFGNPQRLITPSDRTLDFTEKCKKAAEREKIALVKTTDLFNVAKFLSENNDDSYRLKCREAIKSQLGKIVTFPAP